MKKCKSTFTFFLDVKKAYDTVWRDGLWFKVWEMGVRSKMLIYIDGLLHEIEKYPQLGVKFSGSSMCCFADDFVWHAKTGPAAQCLIGIVYRCNYSNHWHFEAKSLNVQL